MKRVAIFLFAAAAVVGIGACERHSFERTKVLHESHGHDDHSAQEHADPGHHHPVGKHPKETKEGGHYGETAPAAD